MSPPTEQTPASTALDSATTPLTPPPISRAKHTRIDIWRNEVAALTLDTTARDAHKSSSRHSPPPSSATSSASSADSSGVLSPSHSSPSGGGRLNGGGGSNGSRARRIWHRLSARITGRPLQPPLQDVIRTEMYRIEPTTPAAAAAASAPLPPNSAAAAAAKPPPAEDEGQDITLESSGEDAAGRGRLKEKQERLERAARLLEQQHGQ